jgi:hypothetical protein
LLPFDKGPPYERKEQFRKYNLLQFIERKEDEAGKTRAKDLTTGKL